MARTEDLAVVQEIILSSGRSNESFNRQLHHMDAEALLTCLHRGFGTVHLDNTKLLVSLCRARRVSLVAKQMKILPQLSNRTIFMPTFLATIFVFVFATVTAVGVP